MEALVGLASPEPPGSIPVAIASTEDLAAMKLSAIGGRGARRDAPFLERCLGGGERPADAARPA
jgi:hypothetical protein